MTQQSVEHPPVTVAPELNSGDADGTVTNTANATGTTPTAATTESRANKLPDDGMPASKMDDSLTLASSLANTATTTVAMSSGMTSAQSLPFENPIGTTIHASSSASSTLPLFPVTPAVVTSLITGGTQTATTHSQANRIPSDYYPAVPPPGGLTSQHTTHNPYYAPDGGISSLYPPFLGGTNGNNPDNHWMGGYDPGRGMYQQDQGGNRRHSVSRGADGNAPDGFCHMDRDRNAHRNRWSLTEVICGRDSLLLSRQCACIMTWER